MTVAQALGFGRCRVLRVQFFYFLFSGVPALAFLTRFLAQNIGE